ncbi:hypothetical protein EFY79_18500 [Hanamia caeni]|jgi:hypothetical protein|uniref:Uncharacterized protein n=1 Tax=Hanamia caeni TaxID=2294116 RepID=A0A3M9N755_9BACT|nr:hypothetical protein [Hanamia caeni]RNI33611.1 hypothetical protein EFY79_18500 [Hanamia caeni]
MARLFVFGIGGTGARVMKSLIMLMASGMRAGDFDVIPILIDPHKDLKELNDCKTLLKLYGNIHDEIYKNVQKVDDGFFNTKITTLTTLAPGTGMRDEYDFDERHDIPFSQFLELEELAQNSPTQDLLSLLYSQDNFNKPLSVGFKGSPNVGSIVLNSLKDSPGYKAFENVFGIDDRVFIISSIFGGTGASGFPLLLKNLRNHRRPVINECQIGALTVMPYFKLESPDEKSDIDSNNFLTKTKAALTYYTREEFSNLYNALYYIADTDEQNKPYVNNEKEQPNDAHLVEVLGALAVLHFAGNSFQLRGEVYEYGLKENASVVDLTNISDETRKMIERDTVSFYFFQQLHENLKEHKNLPFRKSSGFNDSFFNQEVFRKIDEFIEKHYLPWVKELERNERSLSPFNRVAGKKSYNAAIKGYEVPRKPLEGWVSRPFDVSDLYVRMSNAEKFYKKMNDINKNYKYLAMCRKSTQELVDANIDF